MEWTDLLWAVIGFGAGCGLDLLFILIMALITWIRKRGGK